MPKYILSFHSLNMIIGIEAAHANKLERTGVEEYCFQVIQELKKIIPATEQVVLYTNEPLQGGLEKLPLNWEVKILRWPFKKLWSQTRLALELFLHPPDVFFAPGQLLPICAPKKSVTMVHDVAFRVFPNAYNFWGRMYLQIMQSWIGWRSKRIITSSEFNKRELLRLYPGLSEKNSMVIPLGFDHTKYLSGIDDKAVLQRYGITRPYVITVGRLEEKKNTRRLIEAFNVLRHERPLQLVLVGKPRVGYDAIQTAIDHSPYAEDIHELGFVPTEDVVQLVRQAEAFVFPSLYEGFGIPILEAMALGTPVIASGGGALEEVGGKAAVYCNPLLVDSIAKTIKHVLDNPEIQENCRSAGREQASRFSWERTADLTWKRIAELM